MSTDRRKTQWIEKLQVQLVTVGALAVGYFLFAPLISGGDADAPATFVSTGEPGRLALFALLVWAMAAVTALLTVAVRPQGAMLATLLGAGGVSMKSPAIRSLVWLRGDGAGGLLAGMIAEMAVFVALVLGVELIVWTVRGLVRRICPGLLWSDPLADLSDQDRREVGDAPMDRAKWIGRLDLVLVLAGLRKLMSRSGRKAGSQAAQAPLNCGVLVRAALCLVTGMVVTAAVTLLLLQSAARGQILFAVFAGCTVGCLVAHQVAPSPVAASAWLGPVLLAIMLYLLAALTADGSGAQAWVRIPFYARVLPVDWLTLGCGGSLLGYWISGRIHEIRHAEKKAQQA